MLIFRSVVRWGVSSRGISFLMAWIGRMSTWGFSSIGACDSSTSILLMTPRPTLSAKWTPFRSEVTTTSFFPLASILVLMIFKFTPL